MSISIESFQSLLAAYESKFGPADDQAIAALSWINGNCIFGFGENWASNEGFLDRMLMQLIGAARDRYGDDWATVFQNYKVSFS